MKQQRRFRQSAPGEAGAGREGKMMSDWKKLRIRKRRLLIKKRLIARRKSGAARLSRVGINLFSGVIQTGGGVAELC
jgi:hypothetical protein